MSDRRYEICFTGEASTALALWFDDVDLAVDRGVTRLRTSALDQTALCGLLARLDALGLDVLSVHAVGVIVRNAS